MVYEDPSFGGIQQHIDTASQSCSVRAVGFDANRAARPALLQPVEERL